jgi:iron complex outermembrane recepter protein
MNLNSVRKSWAALALCISAGLPYFAVAQTAATTTSAEAAKDQSVKMEKFVVTGTNIPMAGEMPAIPVAIIGQTDIAASGNDSNILEIIRKIAPQFSGNGNLGNSNGNIASGSTNGASALALRNAQTLVLVNGRRLAAAPVAAAGGGVFVDVNAIPIAAIERIEILTDGASAIYGSDAVGGVVNIILKTDFQGVEIGGRYAQTQNAGKYREKSFYGVVGAKTESGDTRVTASYEWTKSDPIYNYERPFADPSYGTTNFAGVIQTGSFASGSFVGDSHGYWYLNPTLNAPGTSGTLAARGYTLGPVTSSSILPLFNLAHGVTMLLGNERKIATLAFDQKVSENVSLFADLIFGRTKALSQLNAQPVSVKLGATDVGNVLGIDVSVRNRFVATPRTYLAKTDALNGVLGFKGKINEHWSWEAAVDYNQADQKFENGGLVRSAGRAAAVAAGRIALFARTQPAGALDGVLGKATGEFISNLTSYDLKFVGTDLLQMPGGGVSIAFGLEKRRESLSATSDPDSQSATFAYDSGTTIDPFSQYHDVNSAFAEVKIPLVGKSNRMPGIYSANLTVAGRNESYSDSSSPTVPKIALSYSPVNESVMFRASFSRSFSAPTLFQLHAPTGIGFTNPLAEFGGNQGNEETLPITSLSPSRSRNFGLGVVWTPPTIKGFSTSLDYWDIKQTVVISSLGATGVVDQVFHDVDTRGAASPYASLIHVGDFTGPTISAPGQISDLGLDNIYFVIPAASNLGNQKLKGFDFKFSYETPLQQLGKFRWDSTSTYYQVYDIQVAPGLPYTPTAGLVTGLNGTIARWRTYNVFTYQIRDFIGTVTHTYYPAVTDAGWTPDSLPTYQQRLPAYSNFDANVSYVLKGNKSWFRGLKITVGVNNIGNKMPTKSATYDGLSNADVGEFSPIGRLYYVKGSYRF